MKCNDAQETFRTLDLVSKAWLKYHDQILPLSAHRNKFSTEFTVNFNKKDTKTMSEVL